MIVYRDRKPFIIDDEIASLMRKGRANHLQSIHDQNDEFLGPALTLGVVSDVEGLKVNVTSQLGDHAAMVHQHGIVEDVADSFADDIEFYRNDTADSINGGSLDKMARSYRSYLGACISLFDYFLYRYESHDRMTAHATTDMKASVRMTDRIDQWISTYAAGKQDAVYSSKEYQAFQDLRKSRNDVVHPQQPMLGYDATEVLRVLNLCSPGIGGLLHFLRIQQGKSPYIGFINQVLTLRNIQKA